jgi:hypothetical protein
MNHPCVYYTPSVYSWGPGLSNLCLPGDTPVLVNDDTYFFSSVSCATDLDVALVNCNNPNEILFPSLDHLFFGNNIGLMYPIWTGLITPQNTAPCAYINSSFPGIVDCSAQNRVLCFRSPTADSGSPTMSPTTHPSTSPIMSPSTSPIMSPTMHPSTSPIMSPTMHPSSSPTAISTLLGDLQAYDQFFSGLQRTVCPSIADPCIHDCRVTCSMINSTHRRILSMDLHSTGLVGEFPFGVLDKMTNLSYLSLTDNPGLVLPSNATCIPAPYCGAWTLCFTDLPVCGPGVGFPVGYYAAFSLLGLGLVVFYRRKKPNSTELAHLVVTYDRKKQTFEMVNMVQDV